MTAAKVMEFTASLPDRDGQAADAVSAYTQATMEDAPNLLSIPRSGCPDLWIRIPQDRWPKSWSNTEGPRSSFARNLYGHPLAGLLLERRFENFLLEWEKVPNQEFFEKVKVRDTSARM